MSLSLKPKIKSVLTSRTIGPAAAVAAALLLAGCYVVEPAYPGVPYPPNYYAPQPYYYGYGGPEVVVSPPPVGFFFGDFGGGFHSGGGHFRHH